MKNKKLFGSPVLSNFALAMLNFEGNFLYLAAENPSQASPESLESKKSEEVKGQLLQMEKLSPQVKEALQSKDDSVLKNMLQHLVDKTAKHWVPDQQTQEVLKGRFQTQAEQLVADYNKVVSETRGNMAILDDNGQLLFNRKAHVKLDNALAKRLDKEDWKAVDQQQVKVLEEQLAIIGMSLPQLKRQMLGMGSDELYVSELMKTSRLKGKKPEDMTAQEKAALARIMVEVGNLRLTSTPVRSQEQTVAAPAATPESAAVSQKRRELSREQDQLMSSDTFQENFGEYVEEARSLLLGSQVYFGKSFNGIRVKIENTQTGEVSYDGDLGGKVLQFVSPEKAKEFHNKTMGKRGEAVAQMIPTQDLLRTPNGKIMITESPTVIDWTVLEYGYNTARKLYEAVKNEGDRSQRLALVQSLEEYKQANPLYFGEAMGKYLEQNPGKKGAGADLLATVRAVNAALAYHRGEGTPEQVADTFARPIGVARLVSEAGGRSGSVEVTERTVSKGTKTETLPFEVETGVDTKTHYETLKKFIKDVQAKKLPEFQDAKLPEMGFVVNNKAISFVDSQMINYQAAKTYLESKNKDEKMSDEGRDLSSSLLRAINVLDNVYAAGHGLGETVEGKKAYNSQQAAETFRTGYKIPAERKDVFNKQMKGTLEGLNPDKPAEGVVRTKEEVNAFLQSAVLDTFRRDYGKNFVAQGLLGSDFIPYLNEKGSNDPLLMKIEDPAFKQELIAGSATAQKILTFLARTLEQTPGAMGIVVNGQEVRRGENQTWEQLVRENAQNIFTVAMVAIPGRLDASVAFKPTLNILSEGEVPPEQRETIDVPPPQIVVMDVFRTYQSRNPLDWIGKTVTTPRKMHGDQSELYRDMMDTTGLLVVGDKKTFQEAQVSQKRFKVIEQDVQEKVKESGGAVRVATEAEKSEPSQLFYKDGKVIMNLTEEALQRKEWKIDLGNNLPQLIVDRLRLPGVSREQFDKLQASGQVPMEIAGTRMDVELFNQLVRGNPKDPNMYRQFLGNEAGILKVAQPVGFDRTIVGMIILGKIIEICIPPSITVGGYVTGEPI